MINVYHRADHDCVIVENGGEQDNTFVHYHKRPGSMALREIIVSSSETGVVFAEIIMHEDECDQSRRHSVSQSFDRC
jgi:hypothetical protein